MSFDKKYYIMADNEVKRRKIENERIQERRQNEAEAHIPDLRALRLKLMETGSSIIRLFLAGGSELTEKMRALERENLSIQEQIEWLLKKNHYPKNYLDEIYTCKLCKDTGIYNGMHCKCFMELVRGYAADDINKMSPMKLCDFTGFDLSYYPDESNGGMPSPRKLMTENFLLCKRYAEDFTSNSPSLLMQGKTGLGKTHLSLAIAKTVMNKNYSVIYGSAPDLLRKIEEEHFNNQKGNTSELLLNSDLLIIDDLGTEFDSKFYKSAVYNIVNSRINSSKPIIINTNLNFNELIDYYGDRITSRLMTMETLMFYGNDIRIMKKYM